MSSISIDDCRDPCDVTIVAHDIGPIGGMERQLTRLIEGLVARGHRVTVIARSCELPPRIDVELWRVRGPRRPFPVAYLWFALVGSIVVRVRRRGVVQSTGAIVLNHVDVLAVHYCHNASRPPRNPNSRVRGTYAAAVAWLKRIGERLVIRRNRFATYIGVSKGVADELRSHYPAIEDRVTTIYNGVDTEEFAPGVHRAGAERLRASLGIPGDAMVAAFVGGDWERKGLGYVIEGVGHAPGWHLVVAGPGDVQSYRALANQHGIDAMVHWLGVVSDVELVYEAADVFVLPTHYETFSLVTFEAAASGLPLLVARTNGINELVTDGENGFFITRDPAVIASRLMRLESDASLRSAMGASARRAALPFGWGSMVTRHSEVYELLAASH